jgi:hypothetical protein
MHYISTQHVQSVCSVPHPWLWSSLTGAGYSTSTSPFALLHLQPFYFMRVQYTRSSSYTLSQSLARIDYLGNAIYGYRGNYTPQVSIIEWQYTWWVLILHGWGLNRITCAVSWTQNTWPQGSWMGRWTKLYSSSKYRASKRHVLFSYHCFVEVFETQHLKLYYYCLFPSSSHTCNSPRWNAMNFGSCSFRLQNAYQGGDENGTTVHSELKPSKSFCFPLVAKATSK